MPVDRTTRELHKTLVYLIRARHPENHNHAQGLRLEMVKLLEEACEAATSVALPAALTPTITELTDTARRAFRERGWLELPWTASTPNVADLEAAKLELADMYILLACLEYRIGCLLGAEWDIQEAALRKAASDLSRP